MRVSMPKTPAQRPFAPRRLAPLALALALALPLLPLAPASPAWAVQPDEVLADPGLESRARALSRLLRCPVCQSETIDESNAQVARDLRLLVRERLLAGDSDQGVLDYIVARYGEYVLFQPTARGGNLVLWLAGPGMFVVAGAIGWRFLRGRRRASEPETPDLTEAEKTRLAELMRD